MQLDGTRKYHPEGHEPEPQGHALYVLTYQWILAINNSTSALSVPLPTVPPPLCFPCPSGPLLPWGIKPLQDYVYPLPLNPDQAVLCCIFTRGLGKAHACCLVGGSVSGSSLGSGLVETAGLPIVSLSLSASVLPLSQPQGSLTSVQWLGVSICFCLSSCCYGLTEDSHVGLLSLSTS